MNIFVSTSIMQLKIVIARVIFVNLRMCSPAKSIQTENWNLRGLEVSRNGGWKEGGIGKHWMEEWNGKNGMEGRKHG